MRVPLEWLKEYVTIRLKPPALAERLTMAGLEVTGIEQTGQGPVLELEITPNRADCLSIIGVAREVAAMTGVSLKNAACGVRRAEFKKPSLRSQHHIPHSAFRIQIEDRKGCRRYIGRLIEGVRIGPSPDWMQRRLAACGIRAINNVVDITNYVLLECGQPLHAFDVARLARGTILVRRARANERLTTLDGEPKTLTTEMLVIADADKPVAVAGVMGGTGSEVTAATSAVLLESALFDPLRVRRTARALSLATESSYRFERGVDPAGVEHASARAARLIEQLAGGTEAARREVGSKPLVRMSITVDLARASRWLGTPIAPSAARTMLARLGCRVAGADAGKTVHVSAPSWRRDLVREVDVYEELARAMGYDKLPSHLPSGETSAASRKGSADFWRSQSLRCLCASLGLTEVIPWALVSETDLSRIGLSASHAARLSNPLSQDHAFLRPSLLIGLLRAVRHNLVHGAAGVRVFEVGHVVHPSAGAKAIGAERSAGTGRVSASPTERLSLGIVLCGVWARDWRTQETADFFHLKGLLEALAARLCGRALSIAPTTAPWAQPGTGVELQLDGRAVGVAGAVAHSVAHAWDLEQDVWHAELSVEALTALRRATPSVRLPEAFPPVKRDLSVLVAHDVSYERVAGIIREAGGVLASRVELIDRYTGKQLAPNTYSLTFSIEYRDPSRTLTAEEVDQVHARIGHALTERLGATLR